MGLDISYYSGLKKIDCAFSDEGDPIDPKTKEFLDYDSFVQIYKPPDFPGMANDLDDRGVYSFEHGDDLRAGSYGGYNKWRDQLAKLVGYPLRDYQDNFGHVQQSHCVDCWSGLAGPFAELINFSDCEGVIGSDVSQKLFNDFCEHQEKVDACGDEYFIAKYAEWKKAFEVASSGGCVYFH